ncbi:MAG: hypothetical protein ACKV19_07130 [Verrucomicrobiales bacterium]
MKLRNLILIAAGGIGLLTWVPAQVTGIGGRGTGADIGTKPVAPKSETTVTIKVGSIRNWKSVEGTEISAELVSWPINDPKAATADPATLKFDIVRGGQIRLRRAGKVFVLPLARLSESDRSYVAGVESAAKKGSKKPDAVEAPPKP